jgi:hypothetical protein
VEGGFIPLVRGIKQYDPLPPLLSINIIMDPIIRDLKRKEALFLC